MRRLFRIAQLGVAGPAILLAFFPPPAQWVEQIYSNRVYPALAFWLIPLTNLIPFAIGEVFFLALVVGLLLWWLVCLVRARRGRRLITLGFLLLDTVTLAALLYLTFLTAWGLNYSRGPLAAKLDYNPHRITPAAERELLRQTITQLNANAALVHSQPPPNDVQIRQSLYPSFQATLRDLGSPSAPTAAIPKTSLLDPYFESTGVTGFTDPFTHEVTLTASLLPVERPFVLAHEWSHVAGYASEEEANFIGLLTCIRSAQPFVRYSGWLALYAYLGGSREGLPALAPQVVSDLRAISQREQRHEVQSVSHAEQKMYNQFLKANRVPGGIGNYGMFVQLMLGTRFVAHWTPLRRGIAVQPGVGAHLLVPEKPHTEPRSL